MVLPRPCFSCAKPFKNKLCKKCKIMASRIIYIINPYLNFLSLNTEQLATELKNKFLLGLLNLKIFKQIKNKISFFKNNYSAFSIITNILSFFVKAFQLTTSPSFVSKIADIDLGITALTDEELGLCFITLLVASVIIFSSVSIKVILSIYISYTIYIFFLVYKYTYYRLKNRYIYI
ncbi:hypothetical protein SDC9_30485 [bioreactor metagenome]|uniref:Uncharacterized protein n=1 Tax=bioreactor metagenome TaxID=1076179 RepID=A0A644UZM0_9ZZZZ